MGFQESENENENNGGLLHGTERCNGLFEALLAKFPSRQGNEYEVTLDSHRRFQAWIPRLHESLTYMVGDKGVLIRQLINSIEANLHCILEIRSHKTDQGTRHGAMEVLANDILSTVSNSVARLEDYTTAVGREFEQDGYSQRRAPPIIYDSLVIRGLILSRFPRLSESILRLLERSVVARREALLSLRNVRSAPGRGFEAVEDQDSSETESLSSVQSESWINYPYPAPPEGDGDAQTKRCDWCYNELEVSKLKNIAWWRKHFLGDLQPYVCLAGCEHPRMLFSKFDEWQDHMDFFHDEDWIKNLQQLDQSRCDATTFSSGGQEFDTSYELQTHKNVVQGGEAFWTQEDFILNRSVETSSIGLATCPLCHQHILIDGSIRGKFRCR
ncbi:hypothetical protein F5B22DRAFT_423511 [Xylaria bambusicola]|uniref:uncharacterized protein n=1 Tax=Xylaria bambusicola TaxID=326684 RepID=UPI002008D076|nr:uncharacterized protein F5B22DRAFT_423511 [Xylaria bambusicola]KAI0523945.1 hypothetical protein F5B22DRAFT_423511 [Xylaria bambusicola]